MPAGRVTPLPAQEVHYGTEGFVASLMSAGR